MNNDGLVDLPGVRVEGTLKPFVLYGQPDGSFGDLEEYDVPIGGTLAPRVGAGDANNDGRVDLIVSSSVASVNSWFTILPGLAGGGFGDPTTLDVEGEFLGEIVVEDFDRDTIADVAVCGVYTQHIFFGTESGKLYHEEFGRLFGRNHEEQPMAVADFDRDGRPDMASVRMVHPGDASQVFIMPNTSDAQIIGDLTVTAVSGPPSGMPGDVVTIEWTVQNQLDTPITGLWTDAVYISWDDQWDINDISMGTLDFIGSLEPVGADGDDYTQSLDVALAGVFPNDWYILVRTDATGAVNEADVPPPGGEFDNTAVSPINMQLPDLRVCQADAPTCPGIDDTFTDQSIALYYELLADEGEDLLITLDAASDEGINELYIRYEAIPSRSVFDAKYQDGFGSDQTARIPGTEAGMYYVLAYVDQLPGDGSAEFNLRAEYLPFEVADISPDRGGNIGNVTMSITGTRLEPGTQAKLTYIDEDETTREIIAHRSVYIDFGLMTATFDLRGIELVPVLCDVVLISTSDTMVTFSQAFRLEEGEDVPLELRVSGMTAWRRGSTSTFTVEITNPANVDAELAGIAVWTSDQENIILDVEDWGECPLCDAQMVRSALTEIAPFQSVYFGMKATILPEYSGEAPEFVRRVAELSPGDVLDAVPGMIEPIRQELLQEKWPREFEEILQDPELWSEFVWQTLYESGLFGDAKRLPRDGARFHHWTYKEHCLSDCGGYSALISMTLGYGIARLSTAEKGLAAGLAIDRIGSDICNSICDGYPSAPDRDCTTIVSVQRPDGTWEVIDVICPPPAGSSDPNDKIAPAGWGEDQFVRLQDPLPYTIRFENLPAATAAALKVEVADSLDPSLDWMMLTLEEIAFAGMVIDVPEGLSHYEGQVEFDGWTWNEDDGWHRYGTEESPVMPLVVDVEAGIDFETGGVYWNIVCADPETGYFPEDPYAGFLPPNQEDIFYPDPNDPNDPPRMIHPGEGYLTYSVRPVADLPTGTEVTNVASIVFDWNAPIDTPEVLNTIDAAAPTSEVSVLPEEVNYASFDVCWSGEDDPGGSGVANYTIYVSDDGGPYAAWLTSEEECELFTGAVVGHTYSFHSAAQDHVGHIEPPPTDPEDGSIIPDATTTVRFGDFDGNGVVDLADYLAFQGCLTGPDAGPVGRGCEDKDFDLDDDVDLADFASFQIGFGSQ